MNKAITKGRHSLIDIESVKLGIHKTIDVELARLKKLESSYSTEKNDPILEKIDRLFTSANIGQSCTDDELGKLYKIGEERYKNRIGPGFSDQKEKAGTVHYDGKVCYRREYGDLIIWNQMKNESKIDNYPGLLFVTDDSKADWWHITSGRTIGVHPYLRKEFSEARKGKTIHLVKSEQFLKYFNAQGNDGVKTEIIEQVKLINRESKASNVSSSELLHSHKLRRLLRNLYGGCQVCGSPDALLTTIKRTYEGGKVELNNCLYLCQAHRMRFRMGRLKIVDGLMYNSLNKRIKFNLRHEIQ